jgi:multicomponent Na+:H+ antiporter subunit G
MSAFDGFTWHALMDWLAAIFLLGGLVFMVIGALGVHRLPDAYNRLHAASKCVTLGLTGMLLAACYHLGTAPIVSKAIITIVFTFVANPIGSHLLAKAAHHAGLKQWERTLSDDLAQDKRDPDMAATDDLLGTEHDAALEDDETTGEEGVQAA